MTPDAADHVAIVGLACRVPGAADPATLWRNLCAGVDSVRRFTPEELYAAGVAKDLIDDPRYVPAFGHLDGLADFDAPLFGYGDHEAALLDPQQRLFLEVAWSAIEDAGYDPARVHAPVGVFAGAGANRYVLHHLIGNPAVGPAGWLPEDWDDALSGWTPDYLPLRVAYRLGLTGPAVAVQTACSSSLVAVCLAAQSLLDYRCDLAIAGGAAVVSTRGVGYRHRPGGTLSVDGVCRAFDADASGQVFGNGAGAVVLKRLPEALADGDHVHAVLAGWAVTNDGGDRAGFTAPGVSGHAAAVAEALAAVGVRPEEVGFVEGHGSGTPVGDAIEVDALTRAFRAGTGQGVGWCALGSVKTNLGNLDAAAGVVGLIKAAYAVRHGVVPATLHFARPHPETDLATSPFFVNTATAPWPLPGSPRRAGVSSVGLGGTNAHVVLAEPAQRPPAPAAPALAPPTGWWLLPLSAGSGAALRELAAGLATHLTEQPDTALADVAYTLAVGRRALLHRAAVPCRDGATAVAGLSAVAAGDQAPHADGAPAALRDQADAWLRGHPVPAADGRRVPLPTYPFQRRRHWVDPPEPGDR
ncbi:MAG TPA: beta-ketoacyl synthase N-terminal-like domain-containing protein [Micromonosporaceae bacterium]|nr:beta-ketoacyl synthase N-terminal-like domain-containing protein [Micromonosporaceae bacterium]